MNKYIVSDENGSFGVSKEVYEVLKYCKENPEESAKIIQKEIDKELITKLLSVSNLDQKKFFLNQYNIEINEENLQEENFMKFVNEIVLDKL